MLYCAVHGSVRDGHEFVAAAREQGAAAALVEREQAVDVPQILVRDGRRAAAVAAEAWYDRPAAKLDLVAVTGTNGKTTSVTLLRHVLSALEPTGSIGTLGAFDAAGEPVPSEAGNLTTPGPSTCRRRSPRSSRVAPAARRWKSPPTASIRAGWRARVPRRRLHQPDARPPRLPQDARGLFPRQSEARAVPRPDGLEVVNADDPAWQRLRREHRRVTFGERGAR